MQLPAALLEAIKDTTGFNSDSFINVHASREQVTSIRVNPLKPVSYFPHFPKEMTAIPWTGYGYYLDERPSFTFDPLFHAGTYYVQEASSMFLEQALRQTADLDKSLKKYLTYAHRRVANQRIFNHCFQKIVCLSAMM